MSVILGINMSALDSSAALLVDGKVEFAVREERLNREKKSRRFPMMAIGACLKQTGITLADVDCVANSWNPAINLERFNASQAGVARYKPEHFYGVPSHLLAFLNPQEHLLSEQQFFLAGGKKLRVAYVNHHECHAAEAFLLSGFDEAAILVADAYGEKASISLARGRGEQAEVLHQVFFPHSLGSFYGSLTQFLGFKPDSDEWKVMGASSFGDPSRYYAPLRNLFHLDGDRLELDLTYFHFHLFSRPTLYSEKMTEILGPARRPGDPLEQRHYDIAAAAQKVTEDVLFQILRRLAERTGSKNLCFSGGVAMNSVFNGKVVENTPFERLFLSSSPDDGGTCIGAALWLASREKGYKRQRHLNNYWGPGSREEDIRRELDLYRIAYQPFKEAELLERTAGLIAEGEVVGWFQGRMEFGERALGNRSILADPRDPGMKDKVNAVIKFREPFRPFAPSILEEAAGEYFPDSTPVPFMEKVFPIRPEKRSEIPAVTHVDGTGRLQTVGKEANPRYYGLIQAFRRKTGVPIVLNTSFNLQGEPIVGTVKDALRTFYSSGMDALAVGECVIEKRP